MGGRNWANGVSRMGEYTGDYIIFDCPANHRLSVVGLGYEEQFGPYRRVVQHAL
jgi:hypothetical protein